MRTAALIEQTPLPAVLRDYAELSKSRIVMMVLITTAAGFLFATTGSIDFYLLVQTLIGTAMIAAGTNALNQYLERDLDKKMERTRTRPLPDGRMNEAAALRYSLLIAMAGALYLLIFAGWLPSFLSVLTFATYIFLYTPLKTRSQSATLVGAIPGALPPMIGWAAASGSLGLGAFLLLALMFVWQMPHFLAIGWLYREDYERGGFAILAVTDRDGSMSSRQALLYALALVPISLLPYWYGMAGLLYLAGALLADALFLWSAAGFVRAKSRVAARKLFLVSLFYLAVVMTLLMIDKVR